MITAIRRRMKISWFIEFWGWLYYNKCIKTHYHITWIWIWVMSWFPPIYHFPRIALWLQMVLEQQLLMRWGIIWEWLMTNPAAHVEPIPASCFQVSGTYYITVYLEILCSPHAYVSPSTIWEHTRGLMSWCASVYAWLWIFKCWCFQHFYVALVYILSKVYGICYSYSK